MTQSVRGEATEDPLSPFASTSAIATAVRSGAVSAAEVVRAALERIEALGPALNCFTVVLADRAVSDAAALSGDRLAGPLAGVPVAVKDHVWLAGAPATNGSLALRDFVPDVDCVAVGRLRRAGAVMIGKTNNPEFCYRGDTDSPVYGLTRNPYDLDRTPGGSSGGSAAAVSAGLAVLAVGTDGGGSIRDPSAFCGSVGHKPTFGLVPTRPGFRGWPSLSVHGPMGRSVGDVTAMLAVMAGEDPADPSTVPAACDQARFVGRGREDLRGLKVVFSEDFGFAVPDDEVRRIFAQAVSTVASLGCEVVEVRPPAENPVEIWYEIAAAESFSSEGHLLAREQELTPYSVAFLRRGEAMTEGAYLEAQERRRALVSKWRELFTKVDLVVSPGEVVLPPPVGEAGADGDETWWGMDAIANLTGQPATSLPCGLTAAGLPVGIQLLGRRNADGEVLSAAAVIERALPRISPPPPFGPARAG